MKYELKKLDYSMTATISCVSCFFIFVAFALSLKSATTPLLFPVILFFLSFSLLYIGILAASLSGTFVLSEIDEPEEKDDRTFVEIKQVKK